MNPLHEDLALLLIDVQAGFLELGSGSEALVERLVRLMHVAELLALPVIATREVPIEAKGDLPKALAEALPAHALLLTKATFNALGEPTVRRALTSLGRKTVAVAGGETDVCVVLTVLALREAGYEVFLLEDCLFTATEDPGAAVARMRTAGAVPTTLKTLAFELTETVDRTRWPEAWRERLAERPHLFPPPEDLAPDL